jgi:PAS domain S-box-containing protein
MDFLNWIVGNWDTLGGIAGAIAVPFIYVWRKVALPRWRLARKRYDELIETLGRLQTDVEQLKSGVLPNGGSSVADALLRLEEMARYKHAVMMALSDLQGIAFWYSNQHGQCVHASEELQRIVGNKALGNEWISGLYPDDRDDVRRAWTLSVKENRRFHACYRFQHADGKIIYVEGRGQPLPHFEVGEFPGFVGCLIEIDKAEWDRRRTARTLKRRRERDTDE